MIEFQEQVVIHTSPEAIFSIYENVEGWCQWDPDVQSASIAGEFVSGTAGKIKPTSGPPVRMRLTEVERNRSFTDETKLPMCSMKFEHHLVQEGQGTRVVHRVSFSGPLAFFFGRVIGRQLRRGLPEALTRLKALAEAH
jgi:ligand-binding SRPBCC domain-containing protein